MVLERIAAEAAQRPGATAITDGMLSLTYDRLLREVEEAASAIAAACPGKGPVALALENSAAAAVADLALLRSGRAAVPLPGFFTPHQRAHALSQSGATALLRAAGEGRGSLIIAGRPLGVELLFPAPVRLPPGTAKVTFTSGSTGNPKGVCLSAAMLGETAAAIVSAVGPAHAGMHCALLPLSVLLENVAGLYAVLMAGGTYAIPQPAALGLANPFAPEFARLAGTLAAMGATSIITVPELLRGLLAALSMSGSTIPTLSFVAVGGARVSPRLLAQAAASGLPVYEGYGLTEAGSVVCLNRPGAAKPGTAGPLLPHVRASIAADGELVISHPVFLGYAGAEDVRTGPLFTGDIVAGDAHGHIAIEGRKSATIITGFGRNVAPEWVESELIAHPVIGQAFVHGDGASGLSALIVPAAASVTPRQVAAAVAAANACLPAYAAVTGWQLVPPFTPLNGQLTANGRLRRQAIAAAHAAAIAPNGVPTRSTA